jgi:hypothetical protein
MGCMGVGPEQADKVKIKATAMEAMAIKFIFIIDILTLFLTIS